MIRNAMAAMVLIASLIAVPAWTEASPPVPPEQHTIPPRAAEQPLTELREDFDSDPVSGWEFWCKHAFIPAGTGRALATQGGGSAVWAEAGEVGDFALKLRYGYEKGTADISFAGSEALGDNEAYHLIIASDQVLLLRRKHLRDGTFPERQLAAAPLALAPRTWHDVVIQAGDGQIGVWIDDQAVLALRDPKPLTQGLISLGAIGNSGYVLYDHVHLIPKSRPSRCAEPATDVSGWAVWSDPRSSKSTGPAQ